MNLPLSRRCHLVSLGCPKNQVDAEVMLGVLAQAGYRPCQEAADADLILVNTCGFIQAAVEESIEAILELAQIKNRRPEVRLVVTGCLVQRYQEELVRELPEVDLFVGPDGVGRLAAFLAEEENGRGRLHLPAQPYLMDARTPRLLATPSHRAYLKVTEGCNHRCSYCLIPAIRGPLRSRPVADLTAEANRLEQAGCQECPLVAQDLTAYGTDLGRSGPRLSDLLAALVRETNLPWIRMLYLHPARVDDALLDLVAEEPRILPYFDIPLQHVSDSVLRRMRRPYNRTTIDELLARLRQRLPQVAIRTTLMVGFPGESEEEFAELEEAVTRHRFDHLGVFAYSNEEGSAAADLPQQVAEEVKEARRNRLMRIQAEIAAAKLRKWRGKVVTVLVEGVSEETDLLVEGRAWFQAPEIDGRVYITAGDCRPGDLVAVRITDTHTYDLAGEIVARTAESGGTSLCRTQPVEKRAANPVRPETPG